MKIGITGAYGFLGSNLIAQLLKTTRKAEDIIAFYSNTRINPVFDNSFVSPRQLDIRNYEDVLEKTRDIDILFHFAGKVGYRKIDANTLWDTNVHGTKNIFDAAISNRIQKIIYISSINVLGAVNSKDSIANEQNNVYDKNVKNPNMIKSPTMALDMINKSLSGDYSFLKDSKVPYFDSKLAAFELTKKYINEKNLPVITIFPGTVVGPGDIHKDISELVERVYKNSMLFTFTGSTSFVDVRDCAEGIYQSMEKGTIKQSYIISGTDNYNLSYKEFMKFIAKAALKEGNRVRTNFIKIPHSMALLISTIGEIYNPGSNLGTALVQSGKMIHRFSSDKAKKELNYHPKYKLIQSIQDCNTFLENNIIT